jgi:hypothetical protein
VIGRTPAVARAARLGLAGEPLSPDVR